MTVEEAISRGNNLLASGALVIIGGSALSIALMERDWSDRADDLFVAVLALVAVLWYVWGRNRYHRSVVPIVLVALAFVVKAWTIIVEAGDPAAVADDYSIAIALLIALALVAWLWRRADPSRARPRE